MKPGTPPTVLRRAPPLAVDERRVVDTGLAIVNRFDEDVVPAVVAEVVDVDVEEALERHAR